jgi:phospholipase A1/A2
MADVLPLKNCRMAGLMYLFCVLGSMLVMQGTALAGNDGDSKRVLGIPGIESYRQMYLIGTFNDRNNFIPVYGRTLGSQYRESEVKFQISFQAMLYDGEDFQIGGSYTQQSYWQLFNKPLSAPFRESDYEPEAFVRWQDKKHPLFGEDTFYRFGFDHQSNGQSNPLSRSWNRLYGEVKLQDPDDKWVAAVRAWWRIPEKAANDDNPNITQYYGYWQFDGRWTPFKDNKIHLMLRDNLRIKNRSAVQVDWSWKPPVFTDFSLYAQAFFGYGENLIDYQNYNTRFGAGILLTNW